MYECYNIKRFLRLILLDAIIFSLCFAFLFIGKSIVFSAESKDEEKGVFLPVIMYHSIKNGVPDDYSVTPEQVESDLKYLKSNGYSSVTAQQLADYVFSGGGLPERPVLITLDDGFYNNLYYLAPLLDKYDMTAIVSVVGSFIDNNAKADPHVPEYSYLTWEDISDLLDTGRFEVGNHTYNMHSVSGERKGCRIIQGESLQDYNNALKEDILLLQSEFHDNTGIIPIVFAYPYGSICRESIPFLKENGFLITLTCYEKPNYITRSPDTLYGINRYNRSGYYTTEEYMKKLLAEN